MIAYLIAKRAGQQNRYFDILASGFCLEGRSRTCFTWACSISEVKTIHELIDKSIKTYKAYKRIMENIDNDESFQGAFEFIKIHEGGMLCQVEPTYAPNGTITEKGIKKYLTEVLCYDAPAVSQVVKHR